MLTATAHSRLGLSIVCLVFFVVVSATNPNSASKAPTAAGRSDDTPSPTKEPTRKLPQNGDAKTGVGSFNYRDDCSDALTGQKTLECITASPNNRAGDWNFENSHTVYFRPEVLSITTISDRLSSFSVKLELFIYWRDPAVKYDLYLLDDIPEGAQAALWSPDNFRPLEMEDFEVLVQGVDRYLGGTSFAKLYGWCSRK